MTAQPSLNFSHPQTTPVIRQTRTGLAERLAAYVEARMGVWIDGRTLASIGGYAGYRSRLSDLNRTRWSRRLTNRWYDVTRADGSKYRVSEYRLVEAK